VNAIGLIVQQLETVNLRFHHVSRDLSGELLPIAISETANPIGFLLWHIARSQDWAAQTAIRGVPEVRHRHPWSEMRGIGGLGIGTGFSRAEANSLVKEVELPALLAYADAVSEEVISWVRGLRESDLDSIPDVASHQSGRAEYHTPGFIAEMSSGPEHDQAVGRTGGQPAWLYLTSVCITHPHRHLGELDLTLGVHTGRAG